MNTGLILTLIAFVFVAYSLLTGKIAPSVASGIAMCFLWLSGVVTEKEVFANFISGNIIVMIGMMVVIAALLKTSILHHIANIVRKAKGNSVHLVLFIGMFVPFILCHFIGGVTAMITVIPLMMALADEVGIAPTRVVAPVSVGAQAGLLCLPIGGGAAQFLTFNQMAANVGNPEQFGFWDFCLTRLPATLVVMAFVMFFGYKLLPERGLKNTEALDHRLDVLKKSELPRWKEIAAYVIFGGSLVLMIFSRQMHISMSLIASVAAFLCVMLGILNEREMYRSVNWPLVFMMAFILSMSTALNNSGAGDLIARAFTGVFQMKSNFAIVAVIFLVLAAMTQIMDNTALVNIFAPIAMIACLQNNVSMLPVVAAVRASTLVSFCTPLASPSSLMAYNLGGYSMKEMMKFNLPCVLISAVISILWIPIYFAL
ncbi:MAG: anion permease [Oscillospiraceae bacterium]|nr:anion permease [Oscillospiraceae bacterium]